MATPTSTSAPRRPLFSLDTLSPNDYILVDEQPYDLLPPDRLTVMQQHELLKLCPRYDELMALTHLTVDDGLELKDLLTQIVAIILAAPAEIRAKLGDVQRMQIVTAFIELSRPLLRRSLRALETTAQHLQALAAARPTTSRSRGTKKSRASAASTRAPRRPRG